MTKVAVSLPEAVFEALERERERSGRSRSALVAEALRRWLQGEGASEEDRRYMQAYLETPEGDEWAALAGKVAESWESWE